MCASVWMFLHTYYTTDNFKGAMMATERTPWWWQLWCAQTCRTLANIWWTYFTGKHNFCHMKTNVCFICIFHTEFKYVIRIALSPKFCVTEFLKCNFSEFHYFLCYQYIINMAEALYYILNIVWASKLNHNKDSKHVCPIKDSQTVGTWNQQ